jgi:hypothetical protein
MNCQSPNQDLRETYDSSFYDFIPNRMVLAFADLDITYIQILVNRLGLIIFLKHCTSKTDIWKILHIFRYDNHL